MLTGADDVRRHIHFKRLSRELADDVADRMVAALDAGAHPDYAALLEAATFLDPPAVVFHTAPVHLRETLVQVGLVPQRARDSPHWRPEQVVGQPDATFVGAEPDLTGRWAHWSRWDIWQVHLEGLRWEHDRLNPGCWAVLQPVCPQRLTLLGTYGGARCD